MAIYYISPYGDDSYNGLGKHPNDATNKPWRTLKKALETGTPVTAGDTVYLAPGDYGGTITVACTGNADTDAGRIKIYGDPRNEQGFTSDGTTLIKPGMCNINETNRFYPTVTTGSLLWFSYKSYLTFKNLNFCRWRCSVNAYMLIAVGTCRFITLDSCCFSGVAYYAVYTYADANTQLNWIIKNCIFNNNGYRSIIINPTPPTTAEIDLAVTISNCLIIGGQAVTLSQPGGSYFAGGVTLNNCTIYAAYGLYTYGNVIVPTTHKLVANNCILASAYPNYSSVSANATGQIVTNNCIFTGTLTNHTRGMNDIPMAGTDIALTGLYYEFGQSQLWGFQPKPFFTPLGLPGVGACNTNPGNLTTDLLGRPRPAGGGVKPYLGSITEPNAGTGASATGLVVGSATTTTLTVSGTSWVSNAYIGKKIKITASTASPTLLNAVRWISSNTTSTLTITPSFDYTAGGLASNLPQAGDTFNIYDPSQDIAVGCYELHDTGEASTTVKDSGVYSMKLNGPGDQEIKIAVGSGYTTITLKGYYDSNYTGTLPKVELLANSAVGLGNFSTNPVYLTKTMTAAANTWETLTFNIFPTADGFVTLRLTNQSTAATASSVYFDSLNIS